jgi:hypothetical protein
MQLLTLLNALLNIEFKFQIDIMNINPIIILRPTAVMILIASPEKYIYNNYDNTLHALHSLKVLELERDFSTC